MSLNRSVNRTFAVACAIAALASLAGCTGAGPRRAETQPFGGTPQAIPGVVEAEHFDDGADGVAFHDLDPENQGEPYRKTSVDVEARPDAQNGHGVGWTRGGEWLVYTVNVAAGGAYTIEIPVASAKKGGVFHLEFEGKDATGPIQAPNTGSWQKLELVTVKGVKLRPGVQTLRLVLDRDGETGSVADIDCFTFKKE